MQELIALLIVAVTVLYLACRLWRTGRGKSSGGCHDCAQCDESGLQRRRRS